MKGCLEGLFVAESSSFLLWARHSKKSVGQSRVNCGVIGADRVKMWLVSWSVWFVCWLIC